ncbi:MAG: peptidylprolyl isomerase [Deltaproteobacteria bacterium]|nr:MAG: peptidylprolyl isomerase [Deltaproteobacteria bacterium]
MSKATQGNTVRVHYKGTLDDGTVFDSSEGIDPIEFTLGEGIVIPGFEQAVLGMSPGESKTIKIPSAEAYGEHRSDLVVKVPRAALPEGVEVGMRLEAGEPGNSFEVVVTEIAADSATLDANHPLAGQDLTFDLTLVEIVG